MVPVEPRASNDSQTEHMFVDYGRPVTFRVCRRVHQLVRGPYVGFRGRFVWFGCKVPGAGVSSTPQH